MKAYAASPQQSPARGAVELHEVLKASPANISARKERQVVQRLEPVSLSITAASPPFLRNSLAVGLRTTPYPTVIYRARNRLGCLVGTAARSTQCALYHRHLLNSGPRKCGALWSSAAKRRPIGLRIPRSYLGQDKKREYETSYGCVSSCKKHCNSRRLSRLFDYHRCVTSNTSCVMSRKACVSSDRLFVKSRCGVPVPVHKLT